MPEQMTFRLGVRDPTPHPMARRVAASLSLTDILKHAPAQCDYHVLLKLGDAPADPLGNDKIGDCLPAGYLRQAQIRESNAMGSSWKPTRDLAEALYAKWSGWDPGTGQPDDGTDIAAAQKFAAQEGFRVGVDLDVVIPVTVGLDPAELNACTWLYGSIGCCWALPSYLLAGDGVDPMKRWDVLPDGIRAPGAAPGSAGYHYTPSGAYSEGERRIITWGYDVEVTPAFEAAYLVNASGQLSRRWFSTVGIDPPGFSWDEAEAMVRDFD
jgi:hypothetical protein